MPTRACPQTQALPRKNSYNPLRLPLGLSSYDDIFCNDDLFDNDDVGDNDFDEDVDDDAYLHIGLHHHLVWFENICRTECKDDHGAWLR